MAHIIYWKVEKFLARYAAGITLFVIGLGIIGTIWLGEGR